eukprot:2779382-Pyramimonas_sp.AAC.1
MAFDRFATFLHHVTPASVVGRLSGIRPALRGIQCQLRRGNIADSVGVGRSGLLNIRRYWCVPNA